MIEEKDLSRLLPVFFETDGFLAKLLGDLAQNWFTMTCLIGFGLNTLLFEAINGLMTLMYQKNVFLDYLDDFFLFSQKIYQTAFDFSKPNSLGYFLVLVLVGTIGFKFLTNRREEAKRLAWRFLLVLVIAIGWFGGLQNQSGQDGRYYVRTIENVADSVESFLLQATGTFVSGRDTGTVSLTELNANPTKAASTLYFQKAVVEPYLLMNYGTTDVGKLEKLGIDPREFVDGSSEELEEKLDEAKKQFEKEEGDLKNTRSYLDISHGPFKIMVSITSVFGNLAIGIPLLTMVFTRFIFQIVALFLLLFLPFNLMMALLPTKNQRILNKTFGNLVAMLFGKAFLSIGFVALFLLFNLIDGLVAPTSLPLYLANGVLKAVALFVLWKKRTAFFEKMGLGYVANVPKQGKQAVQQTAKEMAQAPQELKRKGLSLANKTLSAATKVPLLPPQMKAGLQAAQLAVKAKQGLSQAATDTKAKGAQRATAGNQSSGNATPPQNTNGIPPKSNQAGGQAPIPTTDSVAPKAPGVRNAMPVFLPPETVSQSRLPHRLKIPSSGLAPVPFEVTPERQAQLKRVIQRQKATGTHGHVMLSQQVMRERVTQQAMGSYEGKGETDRTNPPSSVSKVAMNSTEPLLSAEIHQTAARQATKIVTNQSQKLYSVPQVETLASSSPQPRVIVNPKTVTNQTKSGE